MATKDGQLSFIYVRTDCYPNMGVLDDSILTKIIEYGRINKAISYLASVGIYNSNGITEEEVGLPIRHGRFYANYTGLDLITTTNIVKV